MGAVMAKRVSKMIEEQVQFWALKNSGASLNAGHDKLPVITISREFGAKGAALAEMLGERLGFKVWDKELLDIIREEGAIAMNCQYCHTEYRFDEIDIEALQAGYNDGSSTPQ